MIAMELLSPGEKHHQAAGELHPRHFYQRATGAEGFALVLVNAEIDQDVFESADFFSRDVQLTLKRFTASMFQTMPLPGRSGGAMQPSTTFSGSWRIGLAQSTYSNQ